MADSTDSSRFDPEAVLDPGQGSSAAYQGTDAFGSQPYTDERMSSRMAFDMSLDTNAQAFHAMQYGRFPPRQQPQPMLPYGYHHHHQQQQPSFMSDASLAPPSLLSQTGDESAPSTYDSSGITRPFSPVDSMGVISGVAAPGSPFLQPPYDGTPGVVSSGPHQTQGFSPSNAPPSVSPFVNMPNAIMPPGLYPMVAPFGPGPPMAMQGSHPHMDAFGSSMGMLGSPHHISPTSRTVYVGNLPADASVDELLNLVKFGPIENVRVLPEKSCAFLSFLDGTMAAAFHADASVKKLSLHDQELKIGWGKPSTCSTQVLMAVQQHSATRNVYLGQLEHDVTEQSLRDELSEYGPVDQVKIVRDKNIGFVHFLSISTAMKVVSQLPSEPAWAGKRVNYGKDRCAYVPKSQQQNQAHNSQAAAMGMATVASLGYPTALSTGYGAFGPAGPGRGAPIPGQAGIDEQRMPHHHAAHPSFHPLAPGANNAVNQTGNRTVYLGNIHPDTTTEEICNHVRGGILQTVRFLSEKHIAFVTFIEASAALAFHHLANFSGIMVHQRRLKVGWGKHSGPLNPALAMSVQTGGSRNVYIGNIEDFAFHSVEKLRRDFGEYGETELVNTLKEKNCAFVNFCNIQNAIKAIEAMKKHPDYQNQRIGAGKDRCGNPPRALSSTLAGGAGGSLRDGANLTSPGSTAGVVGALKGQNVPASAEESQGSEAAGLGALVAQAEG